MFWLVNFIYLISISIFISLKRRASSSSAASSIATKSSSSRNLPQSTTKLDSFGVPQRVHLPKESVNVRFIAFYHLFYMLLLI
jgi:hypothetical protein